MAREGAVAPEDSGVRALAEQKTLAELAAADALLPGADAVASVGSLTPTTLLVKGAPGRADLSAGEAIAGADGEAARKALEALGVGGQLFSACTRPGPEATPEAAARRVRHLIEALDPALVIALDAVAAGDVSTALAAPPLAFGKPLVVPGRTILAVDGLEDALSGERKAEVWQQFKGLLHADMPAESNRGARRRPDDHASF